MEAREEVEDTYGENQLSQRHQTQEQCTLSIQCSASGEDVVAGSF